MGIFYTVSKMEQKNCKKEWKILTREGVKQTYIALTLFHYFTTLINNKAEAKGQTERTRIPI